MELTNQKIIKKQEISYDEQGYLNIQEGENLKKRLQIYKLLKKTKLKIVAAVFIEKLVK